MRFCFPAIVFAVVLPSLASGQGFNSSIDFSSEEKAAHQRHINTITRTARRYLEDIWNEHQSFYRRYRVSKFYGDRNPALDTRSERIAALQQAGASASLVDQLQPISCVGLTLSALGAGFKLLEMQTWRAPGLELTVIPGRTVWMAAL